MHCERSRLREDAAIGPDRARQIAAETGSTELKRAINAAIRRQALAWGIRTDQARALLFDWRKVA